MQEGNCGPLGHVPGAHTEIRRKLAEITDEPRFTTPTTFLIGETLVGILDTGAANLWLVLWHTLMLAMINKTQQTTKT